MPGLSYNDLLAEVEAEKEEKSLEFVAKDGNTVQIRPLLLLSKDELKTAKSLLPKLQDKDGDPFEKIDVMDAILVAAADRKDSLKKSLADLPPQVHARIFSAWLEAGKAGEASA